MQTSCSGINTKKEPSLFSFQNSKNKKTSICQLVHQKLSNNSPKEAVSIWEKFMVFESVCWKYIFSWSRLGPRWIWHFHVKLPIRKGQKGWNHDPFDHWRSRTIPKCRCCQCCQYTLPSFRPRRQGWSWLHWCCQGCCNSLRCQHQNQSRTFLFVSWFFFKNAKKKNMKICLKKFWQKI